MTDPSHGHQNPGPAQAFLLWDMAGTLIPFDPLTGAPGLLPEADQFLGELGESFRQVVTTGDMTASARNLLTGFGIGNHFERVFGDLFAPVGKPYGAILGQLQGDPSRSLAIGDRLRADIACDTDQVVTLLINQDGDTVTAGLVAHTIGRLRRLAGTFPQAWATLWETAPARRGTGRPPCRRHHSRGAAGRPGFPPAAVAFFPRSPGRTASDHPDLRPDRSTLSLCI